MDLEFELKLMLWEIAKKYLSEKEKEYVLETGNFPFLGIEEEFLIDTDGKVYGTREIVRPIWLRRKP